MTYKLTLNYPNVGDADLQIPGVGEFRNLQTHEVSDEVGAELKERFKDVPQVTVEEVKETKKPSAKNGKKEGGS